MAEELISAKNSVSENVTYLKDYQPPRYFIDKTDLTFFFRAWKNIYNVAIMFSS